MWSETAGRKMGELYREVQRQGGERRGRLKSTTKEGWREEGKSKGAATGCTRSWLPGGLYIDENQQVQSKGMLWPWDTRLRLQFHPLFDCLLSIYPAKCLLLMWETLLYSPCLWIFNDAFWATAEEMIFRALWDLVVWTPCLSTCFGSSKTNENRCIAVVMYCLLARHSKGLFLLWVLI